MDNNNNEKLEKPGLKKETKDMSGKEQTIDDEYIIITIIII